MIKDIEKLGVAQYELILLACVILIGCYVAHKVIDHVESKDKKPEEKREEHLGLFAVMLAVLGIALFCGLQVIRGVA